MEFFSKEVFGAVSVLVTLYNCFYYIYRVLYSDVRPHVFTQIIWGILTGTVFVVQLTEGAGAGAWMLGTVTFFYVFIVLLVIRQADRDITRSDALMFSGAVVAIPVWYLTNEPFYAVLIAMFIDVLAYGPSFRKFYNKPYQESWFVYFLANVRHILSLMAMDVFSLNNVLFSFSILFMNTLMIVMLLIRRRALEKKI